MKDSKIKFINCDVCSSASSEDFLDDVKVVIEFLMADKKYRLVVSAHIAGGDIENPEVDWDCVYIRVYDNGSDIPVESYDDYTDSEDSVFKEAIDRGLSEIAAFEGYSTPPRIAETLISENSDMDYSNFMTFERIDSDCFGFEIEDYHVEITCNTPNGKKFIYGSAISEFPEEHFFTITDNSMLELRRTNEEEWESVWTENQALKEDALQTLYRPFIEIISHVLNGMQNRYYPGQHLADMPA